MSKQVQVVLLCEDQQHEVFARRFLKCAGWKTHDMRVSKGGPGAGSGAQYVIGQYPKELASYRRRRHKVAHALIVIIDGDNERMARRLQALDDACIAASVATRGPDERVAVFVPTWCIETWLAYLGGANADENEPTYPKLPHPRECQRHVDALADMCREGRLRPSAPPSLEAACSEYNERLTQPAE